MLRTRENSGVDEIFFGIHLKKVNISIYQWVFNVDAINDKNLNRFDINFVKLTPPTPPNGVPLEYWKHSVWDTLEHTESIPIEIDKYAISQENLFPGQWHTYANSTCYLIQTIIFFIK